jgi:5-hydroxyisourate hydrolase
MDEGALTRRTLVAGIGAAGLSASVAAAQAPASPGALTTAPTSQMGLSPRLTMHAIDNFHGTPGAGMVCDLSIREGDAYRLVKTITTAANGRSAEPLLQDDALKAGRYELLLHVADYFAKYGAKLPSPNFLNDVPVRFVIRDPAQRIHLPILFSPYGYSYYRGS